jgi:hypothetical protein
MLVQNLAFGEVNEGREAVVLPSENEKRSFFTPVSL